MLVFCKSLKIDLFSGACLLYWKTIQW